MWRGEQGLQTWGILVPQPGIQPMLPALKVQSLNHWTTREAPKSKVLNFQWMVFVSFLPMFSIFKLTSDRRMESGWLLSMGSQLRDWTAAKESRHLGLAMIRWFCNPEQVGSIAITSYCLSPWRPQTPCRQGLGNLPFGTKQDLLLNKLSFCCNESCFLILERPTWAHSQVQGWGGAGSVLERGRKNSSGGLKGGSVQLTLGPGLHSCLTAPPFPGWSLALLGQQYLDILSTWSCSFWDCCDRGDCKIINNFTG